MVRFILVVVGTLLYAGVIVGGVAFSLPIPGTLLIWLVFLLAPLSILVAREWARFNSLITARAHEDLASDLARLEVDHLRREIGQRYGGEWWRDKASGAVVGHFTFQELPIALRLGPTPTALEIEISAAVSLSISGSFDPLESADPSSRLATKELRGWLAQRVPVSELATMLRSAAVERMELEAAQLRIHSRPTVLDRHLVYRQLVLLARVAKRLLRDPADVEVQPGEICPYCRDELVEADDVRECVGCSAKYHSDCWGELAHRCAVFGCAPTNPVRVLDAPRRVLAHVALAALLSLLAPTRLAHALQPCRRPTPASLIYPYQTENVPRDVVIYVRAFSRTRLRLVGPEGRPVLVANRGAETSGPHISGLARLVPTRLLAPMTGYQVQYSREQRDYSKPGMPFVWGPYQPLGRFRTGTTVIVRRAPSPFLSGALEWSKLIPRSFFRRGRAKVWTSGGGRQGTLRLRPGTTAPVVIELQIWITEPGQRDAAAHNLAFLFRPALTIAQAGPCSGAAMLSNVRNGRYRATITPWSPNGVSGPQLRLEGRIR